METCTERPDENRPQIPLLRAEPVDELAGEEVAERVDERERCGDGTVVVVGPFELRRNEVLPRKGKNLSVEIVNRRCGEKHRTHDPSE